MDKAKVGFMGLEFRFGRSDTLIEALGTSSYISSAPPDHWRMDAAPSSEGLAPVPSAIPHGF
ncbi:hypothetical protein PM082_004841 [Marasmius tenuissimus]|nr:hypothetical protein PM082_004841 [Marasmius tenuissimus]